MLRNLLRRSSPPAPPEIIAVGTAVVTVEVGVPVPLAVRKPEARHMDEKGRCVYGYWCTEYGHWVFGLQYGSMSEDTHWISAHAEALPRTCFAPEVGS
jgi:hypothetical protein